MKLCPQHDGDLKRALDRLGLTPYLAKDYGQAMRLLASQARIGPTRENFEPLMAALSILAGEALVQAGPGAALLEACPVCLLGSDEWIEMAANYADAEADRRGIARTPGGSVGIVIEQ